MYNKHSHHNFTSLQIIHIKFDQSKASRILWEVYLPKDHPYYLFHTNTFNTFKTSSIIEAILEDCVGLQVVGSENQQ